MVGKQRGSTSHYRTIGNGSVVCPLKGPLHEYCSRQLQQLHQINDDDVYDIPPWELSLPTVYLALHFTRKTETCDVDFK